MDTPNTEPTLGRDRSLGDVLRDARQAKGLELSDIAEITHVRKEYLKALEADDYSALPEDIYAKNFVKLFAQSVGLQESRAMEMYARARGRAPIQARVMNAESIAPPEPSESAQPVRGARPPRRIGAWLPTVLFIGLIVALALWGYQSFLRPTRLVVPGPPDVSASEPEQTSPAEPAAEAIPPETASTEDAPEAPSTNEVSVDPGVDTVAAGAEDGLFALTVTSDPPGADVTIDGFALPGTTPLTYRLSPGDNRTLVLSLEGYDPYEEVIELSSDSERTVTLTPAGQATAATTGESAPETAATEETPEPVDSEGLSVTITDATWLEVYASTQRGVGERLVYTTVQPGQTFTFSLPVFLHVGNAGGVDLTQDGQALGAMGSSGEVISRAYTP